MAYDNYGGGDSYKTSYGTNGGAGGGGFVADDMTSSQPGGKRFGKDTVRPLTIKQILDAQQAHPDDDFRVDGDAISQITFVGQIRSMSTQATNITYNIDDGTGTIEVKQWIDSDAMNGDQMEVDSTKPKLVENGYCRAWGRLKEFNNKRHVGAHVIRPITDYNEINYHLLEATAVHLFFTRGPPTTSTVNGQSGAGNTAAGTGVQDFDAHGKPMPNVSPLARKLYNTLKNAPQAREGMHVQMLASMMGVGVNEAFKAGEELSAIGLVFTTVDDNTWAILDM